MPIEAAMFRLRELLQLADTSEGLSWAPPEELGMVPEGPHRAFTLRSGSAEDGGEGGCTSTRVVLRVALQVRYRLTSPSFDRMVAQHRDWTAIRDTCTRSPGAWSYGTTGILTVVLGPFTVAPIINPGQGSPTHEALQAEFTLEVDP